MPDVAVVAGVGAGLGAALVHKFASEGCAVAMLARSEDSLNAIQGEMPAGSIVKTIPTDITNPESVTAAFETIKSELGSVNILVNHASSAR